MTEPTPPSVSYRTRAVVLGALLLTAAPPVLASHPGDAGTGGDASGDVLDPLVLPPGNYSGAVDAEEGDAADWYGWTATTLPKVLSWSATPGTSVWYADAGGNGTIDPLPSAGSRYFERDDPWQIGFTTKNVTGRYQFSLADPPVVDVAILDVHASPAPRDLVVRTNSTVAHVVNVTVANVGTAPTKVRVGALIWPTTLALKPCASLSATRMLAPGETEVVGLALDTTGFVGTFKIQAYAWADGFERTPDDNRLQGNMSVGRPAPAGACPS